MNKVRVLFDSVSEIVGSSQLGIILLTDMKRQRQLTIVCEQALAAQIELHAKRLPINAIMLPGVLCRMLKESCGVDLEIVFTSLVDGQYATVLLNCETQEMFPIRASEAVLAHVAGDIPMFVEENLMARQSVGYVASDTNSVAIPINTLSDDLLEKALEQAIRDENYEFASLLRKEQQRREKKDND